MSRDNGALCGYQTVSRHGFIMAVAGAAIGLGNIWRFPYVAGENGGGLFFLPYLLFVLSLGLPVMIADIVVWQAGRSSVSGQQ